VLVEILFYTGPTRLSLPLIIDCTSARFKHGHDFERVNGIGNQFTHINCSAIY
jgi:hypothetical protein